MSGWQSDYDLELFLLACLALGFLGGLVCAAIYQRVRLKNYRHLGAILLQQAEADAELCKQRAQSALHERQTQALREIETQSEAQQRKWQREEGHLRERETKLERLEALAEKKTADFERRAQTLQTHEQEVAAAEQQVVRQQSVLDSERERVAKLSLDEARILVLQRAETECTADLARLIQRQSERIAAEAEQQAQRIIATVINRIATPSVSEATVTAVSLPSEDIKGRIIGREGRNIRHFERLAEVAVLMDDTPGTVVLSSFDPVRKQVAKIALTELVQDGRIHPTRIEECLHKAQQEVACQVRRYGEDAALRIGAADLHPDILELLGKLKLRFSFGQNLLDHSLEVAHILGLMAAELGLDQSLARRIGLLHDIGKAVSHEVGGSHAVVGHDLLLKLGERPAVANGVGCHHGEMAPLTIEAALCGAADAISASRPGARSEAVESYFKRLKQLEEIASAFEGVERVYALQAGREICVIVYPDQVHDDGLVVLARAITRKIEGELSYPGKIKVTILRETRAVQYAL